MALLHLCFWLSSRGLQHRVLAILFLVSFHALLVDASVVPGSSSPTSQGREQISINTGWRFWRSLTNPDKIIYDNRLDFNTSTVPGLQILKPWILPTANEFINDPANHHIRPDGNPGGNLSFVQSSLDDSSWEGVTLPHDWAISGPFYPVDNQVVPSSMGALPVQGIAWYRRKLSITPADHGKTIYLDIDGAMSYAMVWLNGHLVGGWPYPYNSFRLDLTPYLKMGNSNQLAIRLDNPNQSARWYPGGGLYRNVWLTKVNPVHVSRWGTSVTSKDVSTQSATVDLAVTVENTASSNTSQQAVVVVTDVYELNSAGVKGRKVTQFHGKTVNVVPGMKQIVSGSILVKRPKLWSPSSPSLYLAATTLISHGKVVDTYETRFGIRSVSYDPNNGLLINGERMQVQGVDNHHSLGALGAAFNVRAAQKQLESLQDMGCNAIRMSHNPPAPELLDLADEMGFLVMDEIFDTWDSGKTVNDFFYIFNDWHEPDLRAMIRRDRNHPSIVAWSYGNEVSEQSTGVAGADLSLTLHDIQHSEDPSRLSTVAMNSARPGTALPPTADITSLNYQGQGIRQSNAYSGLSGGIHAPPQYPPSHSTYPDKMIWSSETAATESTRGAYIFPVTNDTSAPINETSGGNLADLIISAYELYTADFGSSPDVVFTSLDDNPYVAGEFVWTGFDYLGEPAYGAHRSASYGIVDQAWFKKDRYYLYQARWKPDLAMAHILPHWTWRDRVGLVTPVHVFSSGDEAELFVNGKSQGRVARGEREYRFRWSEVVYEPGNIFVRTYKNGKKWATAKVSTAGPATALRITADRSILDAKNSYDLSFLTVEVTDTHGQVVPRANNTITFSIQGRGELVATDNGDPSDLTAFPSPKRNAYFGLALAIVSASGIATVTATAEGLNSAKVVLKVR